MFTLAKNVSIHLSILFVALALFTGFFYSHPPQAHALLIEPEEGLGGGSFGGPEGGGSTGPQGGASTGVQGGGSTGPQGGGSTGSMNGGGVKNPLAFNSIQEFFAKILQFLVMLAVPFIVFMIIYTGFKFVTAQGNPEALKTAQKMFLYTIIGGMLILGASIVASVIKGTVNELTVLDHALQAAAPFFNL